MPTKTGGPHEDPEEIETIDVDATVELREALDGLRDEIRSRFPSAPIAKSVASILDWGSLYDSLRRRASTFGMTERSGEVRAEVRRILPPDEPNTFGVFQNLLPPKREQRSPHSRLAEGGHAREPHRAAAPQQPEENRLRLIVGVVAGHDDVRAEGPSQRLQICVAGIPGRLLRSQRTVRALDGDLEPPRPCHTPHPLRVPV